MVEFPTWRGIVLTSLLCNTVLALFLPLFVWKFILSFLRPRTDVNARRVVVEGLSVMEEDIGLVPGATALWLAAAKGHTEYIDQLLDCFGILELPCTSPAQMAARP